MDVWWRKSAAAEGSAAFLGGQSAGVRRRALDDVLARYRPKAARGLELFRDGQGKLRPVNGGPAPSFNVSYAGPMAAYVVAGGAEVGIDVEQLRPRSDLEAVVELSFSRAERDLLDRAADRAFLTVFYTLWTRKEAVLKAAGVGLGVPLTEIIVAGADFTALSSVSTPLGRIWVRSIAAPEGYVCACASERPFDIRQRTPL